MKEPRTLCIVVLWSLDADGGVNEVVKNLLRQFATRTNLGFQPLVLELSWARKQEDEAIPGVRRTYLRLHPVYLEEKPLRSALSYLLNLPKELLALSRLAKRENIAAFNVHFPDLQAFTFILLRMLRLFKGKVVISFHGSDIRGAHAQSRVSKLLWRFLLRHASSLVSCSDGLSEEIMLLEPNSRIVTIYNGIDCDLFAAGADSRFTWPGDLGNRRIIINVASFEYRKGHDILLQAFEQVSSLYPDTALVLVGKPGPVSSSVRNQIQRMRLEDRVNILENVPHSQIYDLLTHSTVFVLATRWRKRQMGEGFALAVLEAGAAKAPVVATASCGVEELIVDRENGLIVPLDDAVKLAQAISYMLDNPEKAREMADRLQTVVRNGFTWQQAAEQYSGLCAGISMPGGVTTALRK